MVAAVDQVVALGSNNSVLASELPYASLPAAASAKPFGSKTVEWFSRPVFKEPVVVVHVPALGSNTSELARTPPHSPPDTSTLPLPRSAMLCIERRVFKVPVEDQVPVPGSYSSVLLRKVAPSPPVTSTFPLLKRVAA